MKTHYISIFFLFWVFTFNSVNLYSQGNWECLSGDSSFIEEKSYQYCNDDDYLSNYLLDKRGANKYDQSPIYTVNVKVHVIQHSINDPRNYTTSSTQDIIDGIENISYRFKELDSPTIPVIPAEDEETDSRIRIKVESVDYIQHERYYAGTFDSLYIKNITIANIINASTIEVNGNWKNTLSGTGTTSVTRLKIESSNNNNGIYKFSKSTITYDANTQTTRIQLDGNYLADVNDLSGVINLIYRQSQYFKYYFAHPEHSTDYSAVHVYLLRNISQYYTSGFGVAYVGSNVLSIMVPGENEIHTSGPLEDGIGLLAHEIGHTLGLHHTFRTPLQFPPDFYTPDDYDGTCNSSTISNNIMGYNDCRNYLSPLQIAYIRKSINSTSKLRQRIVETRNTTNNDVIITESNTVWEKHEIIGSNLIIEDGASLTIKCKVHFSPDAKVIIKQGGKLIIDGGTLTNEYDSYWQGIEVWGTSTKNQYPQGSPTYQGILIVRNGGTIENAHAGATNWKPNDYDAIGGVIQATDAIFRNNRVDVGFVTYQNFAPSKPYIKVGNHSFFRNTEFFSDNDYIEGFPQRDAH
ncbi:MAG: hypothetical protein H3C31_09890, partial [Brumimicrobium sp.]|nr:hypothetical protein [Brumimicrobium sp.]